MADDQSQNKDAEVPRSELSHTTPEVMSAHLKNKKRPWCTQRRISDKKMKIIKKLKFNLQREGQWFCSKSRVTKPRSHELLPSGPHHSSSCYYSSISPHNTTLLSSHPVTSPRCGMRLSYYLSNQIQVHPSPFPAVKPPFGNASSQAPGRTYDVPGRTI
jgi:hypothetical protein